jgi:hypothetical protein
MAKKMEEPNLVQKLYLARKNAEKGTFPDDDEFRTPFPSLWQFLTTWWLDDTHRIEAARLEISIVSGDWLFKLHSPSMRGTKAITSNVYFAGLRALDIAVADPHGWSFWLKRKANVAEVQPEKNGLQLPGS